ncbi:N-6 DNA methylase [Micromonospora sp. NBC_01699]|uniref:Eco57I restriction-modification methylase domain-containing protein n=1 Tax=Micromonospora sp. NBC_01699 TaxID=2975984 RepID=UPI002E27F8E2|nr:DNA methyltransferase [Micromonospora sp. NBC_01699]
MSAIARSQVFTTVHTIGGLLPTDMLVRISDGRDVDGCTPVDYHVIGAHSVRDDAERHWDYLRSTWAELRNRLPRLREAETPTDPTGLAIAQWLKPLFGELGFGQLTTISASGIAADDNRKMFAISHRWNHVPIHLIPWNAALDRRPANAKGVPPQSLLQECLNRCRGHLWAVLTNGRQLRLLRDSSALATASYIEFDLEAIFDGELFSEFVLLYRLLHVSRFEVADGAAPSTCWLEKWRTEAISSGVRALDHHRQTVKQAITMLGSGFLRHPANTVLRENLDVDAFHTALLRLVYRLIFLFVIEERDVLHPPGTTETVRRRYAEYFSTSRLRRRADRRGTAHTDMYQALRIVLDALGNENGHPELGLPGLGGLFDDSEADAPLRGLSLANIDLLAAVRQLSRVRDRGSTRWRLVDYRNMGSEEMGSIYESLLELIPKHSPSDNSFELVERLGNNRKKTGSYYTPSSLIERLLDSTLDRVIDDFEKRGEIRASASGQPESREIVAEELLSITVCDPACGSGNFLVAAARRIAKRVAAVRERNPEPTLGAVRQALHEVIARCIYGVDLNPMAVELAKVSLWLEAMEPGKPLGFLDAHLKHGNTLIGATPARMRDGIPSMAFKPIEDDDPVYARLLEKQNEAERKGQDTLFDLYTDPKVVNTAFAASLRRIADAPVDTLTDVRRQAAAYQDWQKSFTYALAKHVADAWCAAFVWHKRKDFPSPVTHAVFRTLQVPTSEAASQATHTEIVRLRELHRFFHWHLEFPYIFSVPEDASAPEVDAATGWAGGFSYVVANPPWDKVDFEDKKYFSAVDQSITEIAGLARRDRIARWIKENPQAGADYRAERRRIKSTFQFARGSGLYPLCIKGLTVKGVNSLQFDQLFTEHLISLAAPNGHLGFVIPTNIAWAAGSQHLFGDITRRGALASLYDFENRNSIFLGIHSSLKFCLLSLVGRGLTEPSTDLAFYLLDPHNLDDNGKIFQLAPEEIQLLNPTSGALPIFRSRRDVDLTIAIYRRTPIIDNSWEITFKYHFRMTDDSDIFHTREELELTGWEADGNGFGRDQEYMVPLYEGKMAHLFDHRWSSYPSYNIKDHRLLTTIEKQDPSITAQPRYWVPERALDATGEDKNRDAIARLEALDWNYEWLCGWRDIARATDERTAIPAFLPVAAVGHTFPLMFPRAKPTLIAALVAAQSSLVFDFVSRQKIGGTHVSLMTWRQLPVPTPTMLERHVTFIRPRVLELVYTAYDMTPLARDLDDGGPPFRWDEDRRARLRAELDAYFFHLYGISRADTDYILETFQSDSGGGLKNKEIAKYGTYRTKDLVLAEYDRMLVAGASLDTPLIDGENYGSPLIPIPGFGLRHDPHRLAPPPPPRFLVPIMGRSDGVVHPERIVVTLLGLISGYQPHSAFWLIALCGLPLKTAARCRWTDVKPDTGTGSSAIPPTEVYLPNAREPCSAWKCSATPRKASPSTTRPRTAGTRSWGQQHTHPKPGAAVESLIAEARLTDRRVELFFKIHKDVASTGADATSRCRAGTFTTKRIQLDDRPPVVRSRTPDQQPHPQRGAGSP